VQIPHTFTQNNILVCRAAGPPPPAEWVSCMAACVHTQLPHFSDQALANASWSLAQLGWQPPRSDEDGSDAGTGQLSSQQVDSAQFGSDTREGKSMSTSSGAWAHTWRGVLGHRRLAGMVPQAAGMCATAGVAWAAAEATALHQQQLAAAVVAADAAEARAWAEREGSARTAAAMPAPSPSSLLAPPSSTPGGVEGALSTHVNGSSSSRPTTTTAQQHSTRVSGSQPLQPSSHPTPPPSIAVQLQQALQEANPGLSSDDEEDPFSAKKRSPGSRRTSNSARSKAWLIRPGGPVATASPPSPSPPSAGATAAATPAHSSTLAPYPSPSAPPGSATASASSSSIPPSGTTASDMHPPASAAPLSQFAAASEAAPAQSLYAAASEAAAAQKQQHSQVHDRALSSGRWQKLLGEWMQGKSV